MLTITVPKAEYYDERNQMFINVPEQTLELEHSLAAISKWESKWHKAFLGRQKKTSEEWIDYIKCMTLTSDVSPMVYIGLTRENWETINNYIEAKATATYLPKPGDDARNGDVTTAELIYFWMVSYQIPFECQYWHLDKLLTLIQVCNIKNQPKKKGKRPNMANRSALNAQRRAKHHTKG